MCCFSREIESVTNTRIFARSASDGRQFIVYAMAMESNEEVAMVLPLPIEPGHGEDAVKFGSSAESVGERGPWVKPRQLSTARVCSDERRSCPFSQPRAVDNCLES
jgi:hypothetical protein